MSTKDWDAWSDLHSEPDQEKRIQKAYTAECTPLEISESDCAAIFSGNHGVYTATLSACTCVDFSKRKKPCKHMYRLAIELGLFGDKAEAKSNKAEVKIPRAFKHKLVADIIAQIENYDDETQKAVKEVFCKYQHKGEMQSSFYEDCIGIEVFKPAIDDGILDAFPAYEHFVGKLRFTKQELIDFLKSQNIEIPQDAKLVRDLRALLIAHSEEIGKRAFPNCLEVKPSDYAAPAAKQVYTYLYRKFDPEAHQDRLFDGEEFRIFEKEFPNDYITDLLNLYGTNPLNKQ